MSLPDAYVPVAITSRSGFDESVHFGALVALGTTGEVEFAYGDPEVRIYPRSANKPMQGIAMLRAGLELPPELLALACASHDGMPMHVDGTRRILATAGLDESALGNTPDMPYDEESAFAVIRAGTGPTSAQNNCSGKHAAMLVTCTRNGWAHDGTYLHTDHPLQKRVTETIELLAGESVTHIGVDGCGAPAHTISIHGLARCFHRIAVGEAGPEGDAVFDAMTAFPQMVGGQRNDVTDLMRYVPGLLAKEGAEGVFAASLRDGRTVAMKISDGRERARPPVMLAALQRLGVDVSSAVVGIPQHIRGHGRVVGEVRALVP